MNLKTYNWNNGTQESPIVLTTDQIKKLIAIGQREDIETTVQGWVTTSSRKMQKFLKYALERQFPDLNIICDEELADSFRIQTTNNVVKEGSRQIISITTDTGITHDFLKWKFDYSNFVIDGDISEQNIKDRIRVENGELVIDDPRENASWSCQLQLTAYPIYYTEADLANIPLTSKPDLILTIEAKKIEDIQLSTKSDIPVGAAVNISVTPVPTDSTKLKGATYSYSTTNSSLIAINVSSLGTEIVAKANGEGDVTVTLHACNNTITKSNTVTFNIYDLRATYFIIDQRGVLSDPTSMVLRNCIKNSDGTLEEISANGMLGDPSNNVLSYLRQNSDLYVGKYSGVNGRMRLKKLDKTNRKLFADGTSAVDYITNESGDYDVWFKFGVDVYYKCEPWTPLGSSEPNEDYVLVGFATEIPAGEDASTWQKFGKNKLIAVYEASQFNNKLYSLSGKRPVNTISQTNCKSRARNRGYGFKIIDYPTNTVMALLFYGYYGTLDCQSICGYGTENAVSGVYYPKITGATDELAMTDTTSTTGNGASTPSNDQIIAGEGDDIKSVNFWGLENWWGDISEWLDDLMVMQAKRPSDVANPNPSIYLDDYLSVYPSIELTVNGVTTTITAADVAQFEQDQRFVAIADSDGNYIRIIKAFVGNKGGYIKKMQFGDHADVFVKEFDGGANTQFSDYGSVYSAGFVAHRSHRSAHATGGVGCLHLYGSAGDADSSVGSRLLFEGTDDTVHIIDDATETL